MTNTLSPLIETFFSKGIQGILKKRLVAEQVCGKEAHAALQAGGDTYSKPYVSRGTLQTYTRGTGITKHYMEGTDEVLDTFTSQVFNFFMDHTEQRQLLRRDAIIGQKRTEAMEEINAELDGRVFARYVDAKYKYGSGGLTTSGTVAGLTLTTGASTNVLTTFGAVQAHLLDYTGGLNDMFLVVDSFISDTIANSAVGNAYQKADKAYDGGYVGTFKGFKLYVSNNLTHEIALTMTGVGVEDEILTLGRQGGVTFTWKDAPDAAGQLHVTNSTNNEAINLAAVINNPDTAITVATATGYVPITDGDDLHKLSGISASVAAGVVTIISNRGRVNASTNATNGSFGTQITHCLAGEVGTIDLAYQEKGKLFTNDNPVDSSGNTMLASEFNYLVMSAVKTFRIAKEKLVDIQINVA